MVHALMGPLYSIRQCKGCQAVHLGQGKGRILPTSVMQSLGMGQLACLFLPTRPLKQRHIFLYCLTHIAVRISLRQSARLSASHQGAVIQGAYDFPFPCPLPALPSHCSRYARAQVEEDASQAGHTPWPRDTAMTMLADPHLVPYFPRTSINTLSCSFPVDEQQTRVGLRRPSTDQWSRPGLQALTICSGAKAVMISPLSLG